MCIGSPPWFDSALCFVLAEIVRDFQRHRPARNRPGNWIRRRARQGAEMLERMVTRRHTENSFIKFSGCETFTAVVRSVLESKRSLYWEELRPMRSRATGRY
jgi:hypothetical protein